MLPLFIDYNDIILKYNIKRYKIHIDNNLNIGLILVLAEKTWNRFYKEGTVKTLSEEWFIKDIKYTTYFVYSYNKMNIELLWYNDKYLDTILKGFMYYMPVNSIIYIKSTDNVKGFNYQYTDNRSPLDITYDKKYQFLSTINNYYKDQSFSYPPGNNGKCIMYFYIEDDSIKFLENVTNRGGATCNKDNSISQKEVSGGFKIKDSYTHDGNTIYEFRIDKKLIEYNKEENASVSPSMYNFHTHPFEAYIRHNVKYAWPSLDDYIACLYSMRKYNTIYHILSSNEGIYVMSLNKYWAQNWESLGDPEKFIKSRYKNPYKKGMTVKDYINIISGDKFIYLEKAPIFNIQYQPWKGATMIFEVYFPIKFGKCSVK